MDIHKKLNLSQISYESINNLSNFLNKSHDIVLDKNKSTTNISCLSTIIPVKNKYKKKKIVTKKSIALNYITYNNIDCNSRSFSNVMFMDGTLVPIKDNKIEETQAVIKKESDFNQEVIETDLNESGYYLKNIEENDTYVNRIDIPFKTITKSQVNDMNFYSILKFKPNSNQDKKNILSSLLSNLSNKFNSIISDLNEFRILEIEKLRKIKYLDLNKQLRKSMKDKSNYITYLIQHSINIIEVFKDILINIHYLIIDKINFFKSLNKEKFLLYNEENEELTDFEKKDLNTFKDKINDYSSFHIPDKYLFNITIKMLAEIVRMDKKLIKFYDNEAFEIICKRKIKHRLYPDGMIISHYPNKDIRIIGIDNNISYLNYKEKIFEFINLNNSYIITTYKDSQIEKIFFSGTRFIYVDNSWLIIKKNKIFTEN